MTPTKKTRDLLKTRTSPNPHSFFNFGASDVATAFHARPYGRFIEIKSGLRTQF